MERVIISGGTGLVGKHLSKKLLEKGYSVAVLSRNVEIFNEIPVICWNPEKNELDTSSISSADYIIHLAGANIGSKRWTKKRKEIIVNSRTQSGYLLFERISRLNIKPKAFITASAIGYYGSVTSGKIFVETDLPSHDFLGNTCYQWERVADRFEEYGIRTVKIRSGVVLSAKGGILPKLSKPARYGIGIVSGNGNQYMPWIHIDDLCNIFIRAIEDKSMTGAFNAVAPDFTTNYDFGKALVSYYRKHFLILKIPAFFFRIAFGEMADIFLKGTRVSADKILSTDYRFIYPGLKNAFPDIL